MKTLGLSDVIGPIMVGPSSSHTAGALRIACMARRLCLARHFLAPEKIGGCSVDITYAYAKNP